MKGAYLSWILASVMCSSIAHFALKLGALRLDSGGGLANTILRLSTNGWLVLGVALHALALALWVIGLKHVQLSVAYPFIALGMVLVGLLSWLFLSEAMGTMRLLGMILISSGVLLVARA